MPLVSIKINRTDSQLEHSLNLAAYRKLLRSAREKYGVAISPLPATPLILLMVIDGHYMAEKGTITKITVTERKRNV